MVRFEVHHFLCLAAVPFAWLLFPLVGCCSLWLAKYARSAFVFFSIPPRERFAF